jgi:hypothetical protein
VIVALAKNIPPVPIPVALRPRAALRWHHHGFDEGTEVDMSFSKTGGEPFVRALLLLSILIVTACGSGQDDTASVEASTPIADPLVSTGEAAQPAVMVLSPLAEEARALLRIRQSANLLLAVGTPTLPPRFVYREVDLDGDDQPEILVLQLGAAECADAVCQLDILARDANGHLVVRQTIRNTQAPVAIGPGTTSGWRDLLRTDSAAGGSPAIVTMVFDGQHYVETERREDWPADAEIVFDAAWAWSRSIPLMD